MYYIQAMVRDLVATDLSTIVLVVVRLVNCNTPDAASLRVSLSLKDVP